MLQIYSRKMLFRDWFHFHPVQQINQTKYISVYPDGPGEEEMEGQVEAHHLNDRRNYEKCSSQVDWEILIDG